VAISDGRPYRDSWQETGFWEVLALSLAIAGTTRDREDYLSLITGMDAGIFFQSLASITFL
jgi:hypothetical protein